MTDEAAPQSFFWQTVWVVVALSNIVRWPIAAAVYFGGVILFLIDGNIFWALLWLVVFGHLIAFIVSLVTAAPFFILGILMASTLVTIRAMWRLETAAMRSLPFRVTRK